MTAAVIVAAGRTDGKEHFAPEKQVGAISAVERVALLLQEAGIRQIAVACGPDDQVKKLVPSRNLVFLPVPPGGEMLHAVQAGLRYWAGRAEAVLVAQVDVPLFSTDTVRALLAAPGDIRVPAYQGRCGHPVVLGGAAIPAVLAYQGPGGLKGALAASGLARQVVEVDDPGIRSNIQKGGDYLSLLPGRDMQRLRLSFQLRLGKERIFYGPGIHQLLQLTEETGSLSSACAHMGMSYSKGRKIVAVMEQQLGAPVLETQQGGASGGFSRLTAPAREMVQRYEALCAEAEAALAQLFQKHFPPEGTAEVSEA